MLAAEGLLDRNAALPLPPVPQRLAVISSDTAAGLADFQRQLTDNPYGYRFTTELFPAAMQGVQTGEEVSARLRQIGRRRHAYDLIVLVRGGGGKTDLAAFNEEAVCRALASASLPVLAGIGHEIDDTVADRVVHRSLKTPTAVAVYLIERLLRAEGRVLQLGRSIAMTADRQRSQEATRLLRFSGEIERAGAASLQTAHLRAAALLDELQRTAGQSVAVTQQQLEHYGTLLDALRPETTLARGYALASQGGKLVTDPAMVNPGEVTLRLRDGRIKLRKL